MAFREEMGRRVLVADGAMGTMLYSRGVFINRCFDELNLSAPDMVRQIHLEYAEAGAEIIKTNTFGANRLRLAGFSFVEKMRAINEAGVRLAKEATKDAAFVGATIGPLGVHLEPFGPTSFAEARAIFREQAEALIAAGADLLILETFTNLNELREAVFAAREAAGDGPVVIAQVAVDDFGRLPGGTSIETIVNAVNDWPADVFGFNCSVGPKAILEAVEQAIHYSSKPLSAIPNEIGRASCRERV